MPLHYTKSYEIIRMYDQFFGVILHFGVLYCTIWITCTMFTARLCRETSRDIILTCRYSPSCTLDRTTRDHISRLGLRRRGCRAGAHCRRGRRVTSSERRAEGIPVVTGRSAVSYVNNRKSSGSLRGRTVVSRSRCLTNVVLQSQSQQHSSVRADTPPGTSCLPSLYVLNAAALSKPHAAENLGADLTSYNIDVAVITETHLKAQHSDSVVAVPGYALVRRDQVGRRGGGVAMYVRT